MPKSCCPAGCCGDLAADGFAGSERTLADHDQGCPARLPLASKTMPAALVFSAPMICTVAKTMTSVRTAFLSVCNEALVGNNAARLQAVAGFALEHLHQRISLACMNVLVGMPRHLLLAFRAPGPLDGIVHRVLHCLRAGARGRPN